MCSYSGSGGLYQTNMTAKLAPLVGGLVLTFDDVAADHYSTRAVFEVGAPSIVTRRFGGRGNQKQSVFPPRPALAAPGIPDRQIHRSGPSSLAKRPLCC